MPGHTSITMTMRCVHPAAEQKRLAASEQAAGTKMGTAGRIKLMDRSAKYLKEVVGAPRFELGTSCAQGRRATRLRYAPTVRDFDSTVLSEVCSAAKQTGTRSAEFLRHQQDFSGGHVLRIPLQRASGLFQGNARLDLRLKVAAEEFLNLACHPKLAQQVFAAQPGGQMETFETFIFEDKRSWLGLARRRGQSAIHQQTASAG